VNVFSKQLKSEKHAHLKNFYIIVPPLTINFVDNIIAAKDRITKKDKNEAAFTDDGMAMGENSKKPSPLALPSADPPF